MMVRFLIHFLFAEHDYKVIDLFDSSDPIFDNFRQTKQSLSKKKTMKYS